MADEMTPEQIAEMQRKNCIFCKIISGEIESKKVFENDDFLAILDIRPAVPGHIILMPKEHAPIIPLVPEERMVEMFALATQLGHAVQEALIAYKVTIFAASGYAAGQQAPHAILHIMPRDKGDGLEMLDLNDLAIPQADAVALSGLFAQATTQALIHRKREDLTKQHHLHKKEPEKAEHALVDTPAGPAQVKASTPPQPAEPRMRPDTPADTPHKIVQGPNTPEEQPQTKEFEDMNEALEAALNMSPDLRKLIIAQPDLVMDYVQKSPKLSKLFEGVNIRALSMVLQRQEAQRPQEKTAADMAPEELFTFIDGNQGLRTWLLENPEELAIRISENPRLHQFFKGIDILDLARRYKERAA
jgi:histidine triad (HIT) family protein